MFQALTLCQSDYSLRWLIYIINSFDNTKLPCYALPPMQHHSFFRNLPSLLFGLLPIHNLVPCDKYVHVVREA